jgi:outer membrane protein assembly factor BamB
MNLLKRLFKLAVIAGVSVLAVGATMYALGWRIQLDGGGMPHLYRPLSAEDQARAIEAHRARQRAQAADAPAGASASTPGAPAPPGVGPASGTPGATTPVAGSSAGTSSAAATPGGTGTATGGASAAAPTSPTVTPLVTDPAGAWTNFRGPLRNGRYTERAIRVDWPAAGLTPIWKQPVGAGYASFVVGQGRAYTIEQRGREEVVAAYDPRTGRELWTNRWNALFSESMGGDGPRATPTFANGRVFALGATGEFRVLDAATGQVAWRKNILEDNGAVNLAWGMSASPLVLGDVVIVLPGGPNGRSVVAYDVASGRRVWSALDDRAGYASPMLVNIAGVDQLLVVTASRIVGLAPDGGQLLWEWPWKTMYDVNAAQPIVIGTNRVFYSSGYDTGATVIEILDNGGRLTPREIWRNNRMKNQFTSSVLHQGYIYGLDNNILACVDANTGELKWKGGRYGYGQVVLADGHLIVATEDGDLALVRPNPERHEEIAKFSALNGKTWNHPSFADGILLVRNLQEMAAFDLRRQ